MHEAISTPGYPCWVQPGLRTETQLFNPRVDLSASGILDPHHWPPRNQPLVWRLSWCPAPVLPVPLLLWAYQMLTWFFFQEPLYWLKFIFHCRSIWAMQITSVSPLLLNNDVTRTQNNCTKEFWEMQRMKAFLSDPRSWLFQSALKERRQIPWEVTSLLLTLLLKKN